MLMLVCTTRELEAPFVHATSRTDSRNHEDRRRRSSAVRVSRSTFGLRAVRVRRVPLKRRHGKDSQTCQAVQVISLLAAPSNLGLRPPEPGSVPGTAKAPEALREAGLFARLVELGAIDAGVAISGRYVDDDLTRPIGHARNEAALVDHARRLSRRIENILNTGRAPLVIGGDCSLLIAAGVALAPLDTIGLVHIDGHTDFRHPGNSDECASVAGEDLAAVVGKHWPALSDIDGLGPYFSPAKTVHIGCREDDEHIDEASSILGLVVPAKRAIDIGAAGLAQEAKTAAGPSYWLHVDVDVLDPDFMPAVDSPAVGGLNPAQLIELLQRLAPGAIGAQVTVFDPDLDPSGQHATLLTDIIVAGLADLGTKNRVAAPI